MLDCCRLHFHSIRGISSPPSSALGTARTRWPQTRIFLQSKGRFPTVEFPPSSSELRPPHHSVLLSSPGIHSEVTQARVDMQGLRRWVAKHTYCWFQNNANCEGEVGYHPDLSLILFMSSALSLRTSSLAPPSIMSRRGLAW